jgi:hypothetical protein
VPQVGDARFQRLQDASSDLIAAAGKQHGVEGTERLDIRGAVLRARRRFGVSDSFAQRRHLLVADMCDKQPRHRRL